MVARFTIRGANEIRMKSDSRPLRGSLHHLFIWRRYVCGIERIRRTGGSCGVELIRQAAGDGSL